MSLMVFWYWVLDDYVFCQANDFYAFDSKGKKYKLWYSPNMKYLYEINDYL